MAGHKDGRPRKLVSESLAPDEIERKIAAAVQIWRSRGFALRDKGFVDKGVSGEDADLIRNFPHRIAECRGRIGACRLVSAIYLNSTIGPDVVEQYYERHRSSLDGLTGLELHFLQRGLIPLFNPQMLGSPHGISRPMPEPDTPRYRRAMAELKRNAPRIGKRRPEE